MKKLIWLFTFLFTLSMAFTSCRDNKEQEERVTEIDELGTDETGMDEMAYNDDFSEFDENSDGLWDENEFGESYESDFESWDSDADGNLNSEEFYVTTFTNADDDDDDFLDETEWEAGFNTVFGDYAGENDFKSLDTNSDMKIDQQEWNQAFSESDWFTSYDANDDELVDTDEWDMGIFGDWDLNDDGSLDNEEYNMNNPDETNPSQSKNSDTTSVDPME